MRAFDPKITVLSEIVEGTSKGGWAGTSPHGGSPSHPPVRLATPYRATARPRTTRARRRGFTTARAS